MASSSFFFFILVSCIVFASFLTFGVEAQDDNKASRPPLAKGLSYSFYKTKCPNLGSIVKNHLKEALKKDIGLAAGLLRLHFHDCFVQGCDASVLLDGSVSVPSEHVEPPNLTLRASALQAINDLRALIDQQCGQIVSCADVVALAARDSVALSGGPKYKVPMGRRDSLTYADRNTTLNSLPPPTANVTALLTIFNNICLDTTDLVALSGGHTIGIAHCTSFENRLFSNNSDEINMDETFKNDLLLTCPQLNTTNTTVNDIRSPNRFDNMYYVDLMNRQGLFTSDQDLYSDKRTKGIVTSYAINETLFFERFAFSMVKMGQLGLLTGNAGEIRANCSAPNSGKKVTLPFEVVEELEQTAAF